MFAMALTLLVCSGSPAPDAYALAHASLRLKLPRTATVLIQNLAYRAHDTPEARDAFRKIEAAVPADIQEPRYAFGYLWPHTTKDAEVSPYEEASARIQKQIGKPSAIDLVPLWMLLASAEPCIRVLGMESGKRSISVDPSRETEYGAATVAALVEPVCTLVEDWSEPRLLAALVLDLCERKHNNALEALRQVEDSPAFKKLKGHSIPPGCDTHDICWAAFRVQTTRPACSLGVTFGELLERAKVVRGGQQGAKSRREKVIWRLEIPFEDYTTGGIPLADALSLLLDWAGTEDASDWEELRRRGFDPLKPVHTQAWEWEHLPARTLLRRILFDAYGADLAWRLTADGKLLVYARGKDPK